MSPAWVPQGGSGGGVGTGGGGGVRQFYGSGSSGAGGGGGSVYTGGTNGGGGGGKPAADDSQPGVVSINPLDPAGSAQKGAEGIGGLLEGLKNGLFGTSAPGADQKHGGLIGDIPLVGDVARFATETPATIAGAALKTGTDLAGGALERFGAPDDKSALDAQYGAIPEEFRKKWEADHAGADKGILGSGILSNEYHYKSAALRAYAQELQYDNPTFQPGAFTMPGSMADTVNNLFDAMGTPVAAVRRAASGAGNVQGNDRLAQAMALVDGQVSTGVLGSGFLAGEKGATVVEQLAVAKVRSGDWTRDEALDFLSSNGAGFSHDASLEVAADIGLDPTVIGSFGAGAVAKLGLKGAELVAAGTRAADFLDSANTALRAAEEASAAAKGARATKKAAKALTEAQDAAATAQKASDALKAYTATKAPRTINVLARAAEGNEAVARLFEVAGKTYTGLEGTSIGRAAKLTRYLIDPMHGIDLHMPGNSRNVDLLSDALPKTLVDTIGQKHYGAILGDLSALDKTGTMTDQFTRDIATAVTNRGREGVATLHRTGVMNAGLEEDLMKAVNEVGETLTPANVVEEVAKKATKEKDLLRWLRFDATQNVLILDWDKAARATLAQQLEALYHIPEAAKFLEGKSAEYLSFLKHAVYGRSTTLLDDGIQNSVSHASAATMDLNRLVLVAKGTLTRVGGDSLLAKLTKSKSLKRQLELIRDWQERYPSLRYIPLDPANLSRSVENFTSYLKEQLDRLPMQVTDDELKGMHDDLRELQGNLGDGYSLGFAPKDEFKWGLERVNEKGAKYGVTAPPWVDHVSQGGAGYRPSRLQDLNIMGNPIVGKPLRAGAKVADSMTAGARQLKAQVSGAQIAEVARKRFVGNVSRGELAEHGLTQAVAQQWWDRIQTYTREHQGYSGPRGFASGELYDDLVRQRLVPQPLLNGSMRLTENDVMGMVLQAYDGDIRYIGLTQKLSGRAKKYLFETTGSNFAGQISEHAWPLLKFRYNPIFQAQEKIEPWVLNAQRGISFATGTKMSAADLATESMLKRMTDNSLIRQADIDLYEQSAASVLGGNIGRLARTNGTKLNRVQKAASAILDVQGVKRLNMLRTFRAGLGKELRSAWEEVRPGVWDDMKVTADARAGRILDHDEFAMQVMGENLFANDILVGRLAKAANKLPDYRNAIKTGAWHTPSHLGELPPLDLDHVAESLHLPGENGQTIADLGDLRKYVAADHSRVADVRDALTRLGADPDYIARVENSLTFSWTGFWKTAAERFSLTPDESRSFQDMFAGAAELRNMDPADFISQVYHPGIIDGTEGILGSLDRPLNLLRKQGDNRARLAGKAGVSTRDDLIRQMSSTFANFLDPSAKRSLLMEFKPELRKAVLKGDVRLDLKDLKTMWDADAENLLADRIIRYMDGKPGEAGHDLIEDPARGVASVRKGADKYQLDRGVTPLDERRHYKLDGDTQAHYDAAAKAYGALPEIEFDKTGRIPNFKSVNLSSSDIKPKPAGVDDATYAAYEDFAIETRAQWDHMVKPTKDGGMGIKVTVSKTDPYVDSAAMRADVARGRLKVMGVAADHPLLTNEQTVMFRAVHDVFGHSAEGFEFGPRGELNAAAKHSQMYGDTARPAMLTETHGQTAYNNFSDDVIKGNEPRVPLATDNPVADYEARHPFETPEMDQPLLPDPDFPHAGSHEIVVDGEDWGGGQTYTHITVESTLGPDLRDVGTGPDNLFTPEEAHGLLDAQDAVDTMFPDYKTLHVDAPNAFHEPGGDGVGLGQTPDIHGFTIDADGPGLGVTMFSPALVQGSASEKGLASLAAKHESSKTLTSFNGKPRLSDMGTPYNVGYDIKSTVIHEKMHVIDEALREDYGQAFPVAKPEYAAYGDFVEAYRDSKARRMVSEYGMTNDNDMIAELGTLAFDDRTVLTKLDPEVQQAIKEFKQVLRDLGVLKDAPPVAGAGKTVREANAAKRGTYYVPQKAALLPQAMLDEFGAKFVGVGKHIDSNPDVARTAQMFGKWSGKVIENGLLKGDTASHANILHDIGGIPTHSATPYNLTEAMAHQLASAKMADKWRDAFRLQYFSQERSMLERSINHPMFGLYPASYMWGKLGPEVVQFLAQRPFGIRTGGAAYSLLDAQKAIAIQREFDPGFDKKIEDLGHSQAMSFLGYMLPTLPWEITASAPIWMKDIAAQGATNEKQVAGGGSAEPFNALKPMTDVVKKLNPLETTLPWAARAIGEAQDTFGPDKQDPNAQPVDATKGMALGGPLERAMRELQDTLAGR